MAIYLVSTQTLNWIPWFDLKLKLYFANLDKIILECVQSLILSQCPLKLCLPMSQAWFMDYKREKTMTFMKYKLGMGYKCIFSKTTLEDHLNKLHRLKLSIKPRFLGYTIFGIPC